MIHELFWISLVLQRSNVLFIQELVSNVLATECRFNYCRATLTAAETAGSQKSQNNTKAKQGSGILQKKRFGEDQITANYY